MFSNCLLFNGRESAVSLMALNLQRAFEKDLEKLPVVKKKVSPPSGGGSFTSSTVVATVRGLLGLRWTIVDLVDLFDAVSSRSCWR